MIELLAPVGDMEKLKMAIKYGADAVYFGGELFSLRAGAGNLSVDEIREGMSMLHDAGLKGYMTVNIYAHNADLKPLREYLGRIKDIPIDAFIISDPGVMTIIREELGDAEIHLSTQANTTNMLAAAFWRKNGIRRIVAARELSLKELSRIDDYISGDMEIEAFVHGAMCMSYSGRCLLSNYMTGRDANQGECSHPCRWKYAISEEKRPGEFYPIEEDARGSYILNSHDLCMIDSIPDLIDAGVMSLKIEGRNKSVYYLATVLSAYRAALDAYLDDPNEYKFDRRLLDEVAKASHREFSHGFYYDKDNVLLQNYLTSEYIRDYTFVGIIRGYERSTGLTLVEQRNKFEVGDRVEIFGPRADMDADYDKTTYYIDEDITAMYDEEGKELKSAPHAQQILKIRFKHNYRPGFMLRMKKESDL